MLQIFQKCRIFLVLLVLCCIFDGIVSAGKYAHIFESSSIDINDMKDMLDKFRAKPEKVGKILQDNYMNTDADSDKSKKGFKLEKDPSSFFYKKSAWNTYYYHGKTNIDETVEFLKKQKPITSNLEIHDTLNFLAMQHAELLATENKLSHNAKLISPLRRFQEYSDSFSGIGENIMAMKCSNLANTETINIMPKDKDMKPKSFIDVRIFVF